LAKELLVPISPSFLNPKQNKNRKFSKLLMATDIDENFDVLDFNLNQKLTLFNVLYVFISINKNLVWAWD